MKNPFHRFVGRVFLTGRRFTKGKGVAPWTAPQRERGCSGGACAAMEDGGAVDGAATGEGL